MIGRLWRRIEVLFWWLRRRWRRRQQQLEAQIYELGRELWDMVDDLPSIGRRSSIAPIRNQFYGHGSFMGAAPALLDDPRWRKILAFLMPDVYRDVEEAVRQGARTPRIIPMFENNPVMAAYGTWRNAELRREAAEPHGPYDLSGHEWDVFVDSDLVRRWERAAPDEARNLVQQIVDTMLVAHATSTDTLQEQVGLDQYSDVRRTRKTSLGGVEAPAWIDLFARALALAGAADLRAAIAEMAGEARHLHVEECREHTFVAPRSFEEAVRRAVEVTGRPHLSIVLEIKSLRSTPALLRAIVTDLNGRGVHVSAVGSFARDEIAGLADYMQHVRQETLPGPRELLFFHTVGDLQSACRAGDVSTGQHALFNGAGLLDEEGDGYRPDDKLLADLERYRQRYGLVLGYYVQESDCDAAAAAVLAQISLDHPLTFELGFAWGGLQNEAVVLEEGVGRRGYGSQALLLKLGVARLWQFDDP